MIVLKSKREIEIMRQANGIVAGILSALKERIQPGMSTGGLDRSAEKMTRELGAVPAFKGYAVGSRVFPGSVCISINEEVVHGIPSDHRLLCTGDIVSLDFGVKYKGYFGDAAVTIPVGEVDEEADRLMSGTEAALWAGIHEARPGKRLGDISAAVQECVEARGFSVVRDFVGHGIGKKLHEEPQVPNFGSRARGVRLRAGMVLAIEPMVNVGTPEVVIKKDGWTAVARDGRRSAHFEHSIAILEDGPCVLSQV